MPRGKRVTGRQLALFLERIAAGDTIAVAARAAGQSTPSGFYSRADRKSAIYDETFAAAFADAVQERAALRADLVDEKFDDWIESDECPAPIRLAWARRWNPGYREKQQVEMTGPGGGPPEIVVRHDPARILEMLEEVGLVRRIDAEALDGSEPQRVLPARTD